MKNQLLAFVALLFFAASANSYPIIEMPPDTQAYSIEEIAKQVLEHSPQLTPEVERLSGYFAIYEYNGSTGPKLNKQLVSIKKLDTTSREMVELTSLQEADVLKTISIIHDQALLVGQSAVDEYNALVEEKENFRATQIAPYKLTVRKAIRDTIGAGIILSSLLVAYAHLDPFTGIALAFTMHYSPIDIVGPLMLSSIGAAGVIRFIAYTLKRSLVYFRQGKVRTEIEVARTEMVAKQIFLQKIAQMDEHAHKANWAKSVAGAGFCGQALKD